MRKPYIDSLRCTTVLTVIVFHIVYQLNSIGAVRNLQIPGEPSADVFIYIVYPWFMNLLFLLAGISARYSLQKRSSREFLRDRVRRLLIPSIAGIFILGWITGYFTSKYINMFGPHPDKVPGVFKYLAYCLFAGIGPLWFLHVLFLASLLLLLFRKIDRNDRVFQFCSKVNFPALLLLFFPVWGSSYLLNVPLLASYRNGIYFFLFFLGYCVFSHDKVQETLKKYHLPLLIASVCFGVIYTMTFWGKNCMTTSMLSTPLANAFLWITILALIGCFQAWCNQETAFIRYLRPRSFGFYVLHYPLMTAIIYFLYTTCQMGGWRLYIAAAIAMTVLLPLLFEGIRRIPALNTLLLGASSKRKNADTI